MVARPGQYQASFNSGEMAPNVWGRADLKQFYSGASEMRNAEPVPQGGFDNAPGSILAGEVRGELGFVTAAYEGGSLGPWSGTGTLWEVSFAETVVEAVDLVEFSADNGLTGFLRIETKLDAGPWTPFGFTTNVQPQARWRRVAVAPGQGVRATRLRLRLFLAPPFATTFSLTDLKVLTETAPLPAACRVFEHTYAVGDAFTIVFTPGNGDIWKGDSFVASVETLITAAMLPELNREQRLNTMLLFHDEMAVQRIVRVDSDFDWASADAPFVNVPEVDLGGVYSKTDDKWRIWVSFPSTGDYAAGVGATVSLTINGEETTGVAIPGGPDYNAFAAALALAIEALPSVGVGVTCVLNDSSATQAIFDLTFTGADNSGSVFMVTPRVVNTSLAAATAVHSTVGSPGGEAIMSPGRGYPATGGFYQDRLYVAGFKAEAGAAAGSVTGEYFDLNIKIENPAGGLLFRLDTSGAEQIVHLAQSKHLVIFTNEAEYYVSDRAIVRTQPPNTPRSSRNGTVAGIKPVESNDGLLYVGRSRSIIFSAVYSDVSQSYESDPITLLASHLIAGVSGMALQRSSLSTDASRLWLPRDNGELTCGILIRNQDVIAFIRWQTDGLVRDVCVDGNNETYALIERPVGAGARILRERLTRDALLHQQVAFSFGVPTASVTGLDLFEGRQVWAIVDGFEEGPHLVTDGAITLDHAGSSVLVGRWVAPSVKTLPLPRLVGERMQLARPVRVHTVRAVGRGVTSLAIGANGRPPKEIGVVRYGEPMDQPAAPCERELVATGLMGWSDEGIVELTQTRPGGFGVRSITIEARV